MRLVVLGVFVRDGLPPIEGAANGSGRKPGPRTLANACPQPRLRALEKKVVLFL